MGVSTTASRVGLIDRLNAFRERYGVKSTFFKAVDVVLHKVFRAYVHTVVWLDLEPVAKMACSDPRFSFRFLSADEIEKFAEEPSYFIHPSLADGVRNGREVCFAAFEGDRLAAFGCYTLGYVPPDQASWGQILADASGLYDVAWWLMVFPGAFLVITTLAFNLLGDGLRDALDVRKDR